MSGSPTVTGSNVTDPDAFGPIATSRVPTTRPSISSRTACRTADALRLISAAVIVARSSPENDARSMPTFDTARSDVAGSATETGVIVAPSGRWISSWRAHPDFWKSLIR